MENNRDFENIKVDSRATFINFLKYFRRDFTENKGNWENNNLTDFLEALESYTEDIDGYYQNLGESEENADEATWKRFADILKGARVYE